MQIRPPLAATGTALVLVLAAMPGAHGQALQEFSTQGLPGSHGVVVRVSHPAGWKKVATEDEMALAELRGAVGPLTGILQVGRGRKRQDMAEACRPEHARTMLQAIAQQQPGTRVTDVVASRRGGRPAYEIRYDRSVAASFLRVRSVIVCLKDSKLLVSCGGTADRKAALAAIEPVCESVLQSLTIEEP